MPGNDPRVDEYIRKAAPFAQPILKRVRKLVHQGCPEVQETIKWRFPHFDYKGPLLGMAAFKQHCSVGFWKGDLILGKEFGADGGMGDFGKITTLGDLPADKEFVSYVRKAAELNEQGVKSPRLLQPKKPKQPLTLPDYFTDSLKKNKKAAATFEKLSYSHKKEYLEWITEAKREETRNQRLRTAVEWLAQGKPRNWKYMRR